MLAETLLIAGILTGMVGIIVWRRQAPRTPAAKEPLYYKELPPGSGRLTPVAKDSLYYKELHQVPGRLTLHLSGEQFDRRQSTIRRLTVGMPLRFHREPDNPYDQYAVAVTTARGEMVGYIPRKNSEWVSRLLDQGQQLSVSTAHLFDDDDDGIIDVQVHIDGVPPRHRNDPTTEFAPIEALQRCLRDVDDAIRTAEQRVTPKAQLRWYRRAGLIAETAYKQFGPQLQRSAEALRCYDELLDAVQTAAARIQEIETAGQIEPIGKMA